MPDHHRPSSRAGPRPSTSSHDPATRQRTSPPPSATATTAAEAAAVAVANDQNGGPEVVHNPQTCPSPFHPRPLIRELLRTRYTAPGAVLLVEAVDVAHTSDTGRWRTIRLLLGDGELCVQALLAVSLHRYIDTGEVGVGTYLRLEEFKLETRTLPGGGSKDRGGKTRAGVDKRRKGKEKASGRMLCLIVESMVPIGWNRALLSMARQWAVAGADSSGSLGLPETTDKHMKEAGHHAGSAAEGEPLAAADLDATKLPGGKLPSRLETPTGTSGSNSIPRRATGDDKALEAMAEVGYVSDDDDDDFEVMPVSQTRPAQKESNSQPIVASLKPDTTPPRDPVQSPKTSRPAAAPPAYRPLSSTTSTTTPPIKLTLLKSIPSLPYKQNWSVNVLAVVSAVSDLEPSYLPGLYAHQRTARLADPSTPKHVLLTVFLDPEEFSPAVGSVVLLLGVKNHMFDGGSLKKYASDRPKSGGAGGGGGGGLARGALYGHQGQGTAAASAGGTVARGGYGQEGGVVHGWWFEDPVQFAWCDVAGLKTWWASQQAPQ
ncbi:hypothetical protein Micbo1qcDRAFT_156188 [Microdochium bolleyi]|uniref:Uncharacterized protein n=1 Tax=Microdochium bolleyi TaxID=196109 RepID=A0A136JJN1_9PEZI|nr:hypothetical protein Micbo1qcDRAFT_156188 [Microdochium bolleyi]